MKKFYEKLIETFIDSQETKDKYLAKNIRPVKHLDLYSGQDVNPEYFELQVYPALFVHFAIDHQNNIATLTFRLCYEQLRDTSSNSVVATDALKFFDFIELTDEILRSLETESFGKLQPITTEQQTEETVTDQFTLTYEASYTKNASKRTTTGIIDDVEIKGDMFKKLL